MYEQLSILHRYTRNIGIVEHTVFPNNRELELELFQ